MRNLREFVALLESRGQLRRITAPVSCDLEITEITDRVSKSPKDNVALLFENVVGGGSDSALAPYSVPVLTNAFGSAERMAWALGAERLDDLRDRLGHLLVPELPGSLMDKLKKGLEASEVIRFAPRTVRRAPCQEVVLRGDQASLARFPILKCWPGDGGRFITLPVVITGDPATGSRNLGMYRLQVFDERSTGMHWHIHKGGAAHYRQSEALQQRLPVAVALGPEPAVTYAASAPLPPGIDEMLFAGWLQRRRVEMVKCVSHDLMVPAQSEIIMEGYCDPAERRLEGPFGDHTGYYSLADQYPVFHITAITHRREPIYPATIVGRPPMEDGYLGKATERLFLPLMRLFLPEITDVHMPLEGGFHNLVLVSIKKTYPGQARKVMYGLWGLGLMMLAKAILVVDDDTDVQNLSHVAWRAANNVDPRRDLVMAEGPLDALDHASPTPHYGSKVGIDATRKLPEEGHGREWPADIAMSPEVVRQVTERWAEIMGGRG